MGPGESHRRTDGRAAGDSRKARRARPDEIHKLASKTKKQMGAEHDKASCHSDYVDSDEALKLQDERLPVVER